MLQVCVLKHLDSNMAVMKLVNALVVVLSSSVVIGFNLEPRIPVIKNGMAGSYFGYSVAQHQSVSLETGAILNNW